MPDMPHAQAKALEEVDRFFTGRPSPERIVAFHPSQWLTTRAYELVERKREGNLSDEECRELETYLAIEHRIRLAKAEAHHQILRQREQAEHRTPADKLPPPNQTPNEPGQIDSGKAWRRDDGGQPRVGLLCLQHLQRLRPFLIGSRDQYPGPALSSAPR